MLMLLFQIADEPWAIAASEVKDLVPLVRLQPYTGAHFSGDDALVNEAGGVSTDQPAAAQIVGLLNYHGEYLPVIDVAQSVIRQRAPFALSTRIAIVEAAEEVTTTDAAVTDSRRGGVVTTKKRGLILDRAYETAHLSKAVDLPVSSLYVNATLAGPGGIVQQLAIAPFFQDSIRLTQQA